MLPPDYRWEIEPERELLYLYGLMPYPRHGASCSRRPGGGGVLLHWGVRQLPHQRLFATLEGARAFAEAWAAKWDSEIRRVIKEQAHDPYDVCSPSPEVAKAAASRDLFRRRGPRKDWWKKDQPGQA